MGMGVELLSIERYVEYRFRFGEIQATFSNLHLAPWFTNQTVRYPGQDGISSFLFFGTLPQTR